ncbi:MAG TPA: hypothetical protein VNA68_02325 [Candidatus Dormibacteraeota bacterium]|nr:hypothetical protein [Candidatus Dormibacteraeota bacterium]
MHYDIVLLDLLMNILKNYLFLYVLAVFAAIVYLGFVWQTPIATTSEELRIYTTKIKFVRFVLSFGYIISWFAAAYAVMHLARYCKLIHKSPESRGFSQLLSGLLVITLGMLAWPPMTAVRALFTSNPDLIQVLTYFFNYLMIIPPLVGFYLIYRGTSKILEAVKVENRFRIQSVWWFLALALFAVLYLWLLFINPQRNVSPAPGVPATFYLPDPLIIATIVLPAFTSWILGILAIVKINNFKDQAPGLIYKSALPAFSGGLAAVIIGSAALQAVVSVGTNKLFQLGAVPLVLTIYTFAGMLALGFMLLAKATKRLSRIEEI